MIEWSEMHLAARDATRRFIEAEVVPRIKDIEHGGEPPYDVLRKMLSTFGLGEMAAARFARQMAKEKERAAKGEQPRAARPAHRRGPEAADELALQRRRAVKFELLDREQIRQFEPSLAPIFERAIFHPEHSMTVNNFRLVQRLAADFVLHGGALLQERVSDIELGPKGPRCVVTDKARHDVDAVVVAAGAWSRELTRRLGHKVALDTERGYHVTLPDPGVKPRLPIHIADFGFVATPLEHGLRFAGTVELGGLAAPPNWGRAEILLKRGRQVFPGLKEEGRSQWMGFRPSVPDSVPVISGSPRLPNAYFAFGHGHMGLSFGPITGRLIADLAAGRDPGLDMRPYRVDRW